MKTLIDTTKDTIVINDSSAFVQRVKLFKFCNRLMSQLNIKHSITCARMGTPFLNGKTYTTDDVLNIIEKMPNVGEA